MTKARTVLSRLRRGDPAKKRQDKTLKTIALLEKKLPVIKRLSRSPRFGKWMPSVVAVTGGFASVLLIFVITPLLNLIPWPQVDIPFPHIDLPSIPLPDLPELPEWLSEVMFWLQKSWPIWIALGFLYLERRRLKKKDANATLSPGNERRTSRSQTDTPTTRSRRRSVRALWAVLAVAALVVLLGAASSQAAAPATADRFVATELPDSQVGRQLQWCIEASKRLPLSDAELGAHFTKAFLATPGQSAAETNQVLRALFGSSGMRLVGLTLVQPDTIGAVVRGRAAQEWALTFVVDRAGLIKFATLYPAMVGPQVTLPKPSGSAAVGTDVVQLVDRARGGRRLMLTRWYPAATGSRDRPLAAYASPLLTAVLGLPPVRVHARTRAPARRGRLPVVLFSPGWGVSRVIYQALAEDLASHGYLVIAVDHTGETPVEFPDGRIRLPSVEGPKDPLATASATRLADMRLVLRRLNTMATGPRADRRRVAAMGHSLGGSTAAALMRVEPTVRAGIDLDGTIFGAARKRGVPRAFLVMTGGDGLDSSIRGLLEHSRGPSLGLAVTGFEHGSFSDLPAIAPDHPAAGQRASPRDISLQGAYVRAFLDRHLRNRPSPLLDGPSRRFPQVTFKYRGG